METIELSGRTGQEVYEELKHRLEGMGYGGLFSRLYRPALRLRIPSPVPLRGGSLPAYRAEIHPLWRRERVLPSLRLKSSTSQKVFTPTAFADAPTRRWTMFPSPSGPDKLMG